MVELPEKRGGGVQDCMPAGCFGKGLFWLMRSRRSPAEGGWDRSKQEGRIKHYNWLWGWRMSKNMTKAFYSFDRKYGEMKGYEWKERDMRGRVRIHSSKGNHKPTILGIPHSWTPPYVPWYPQTSAQVWSGAFRCRNCSKPPRPQAAEIKKEESWQVGGSSDLG